MNRRLFEYVWRRNVYAARDKSRSVLWSILALLPMILLALALLIIL